MANPLNTFLSALRPTPAPVEKATTKPMALGTAAIVETSLKDAIGQSHDYDFSVLYGLYKYNTDVSGSVHKWSGGITSPGWQLRLMDEDATPTTKQDHQMKELRVWLKRPNPNKGMSSLLYTVVQHLAINGDAFWYVTRDKKGMPLEIWPMHPALTRIVSSQEGVVLGYVMRSPHREPVTFTPDEVIHFQLPNPSNDVYGEGRVELAVEEAGIDLQALRANKSIFVNGLSPSAILILDEKADEEDAKRLTEMIRQNHTGADNRHKILAVSRVVDFKPYSMTLKDMEFIGLRNLATEKVTTVMGVPKVLLGNHNSGDYATTKFLVREMHQNVFMPVQSIIGEAITEHLIHSINPDFEWSLNKPDASDPDDLRKDQMLAKDKGILTADEVRHDSFGKEPMTEEDKAQAAPPVAAMAPPLDPNTPTDTTAPKEVDTNDGNKDTAPKDLANDKAKKSLSITKALSPDELDLLAAAREAELNALADDLIPAVGQFFTGQEADYLNRLDTELTTARLPGFINAAAAIQDTQLHMLLFGLLVASLNAGSRAGQLQISITLGFNQTNPFVQDYLQTQALQHAQGINTTTREAIKAQLSEGLKAGEGVPELSKRIQSVFTDAKGYRSTLIARAETAQAYAHANEKALEASGVVEYYMWLTAGEGESRVCPICAPLNGYVIRASAKFPDDLEPSHAHILCRCQKLGVTKEDYNQFNQRNG